MAVNTDAIYEKYGVKKTGGATAPSKSSTDYIYEKYGVKRSSVATPTKTVAPAVTIPAEDTGKKEQDHVDAYLAEITGKANKATEETREGANPQYVASRLGTGAAKTAQGVANALATLGQTMQKNQLADQAMTVGAIGTVTGNKTLQSGAKDMEAQSKQELQTPFSFGDKQAQKVQEKYGEVSGFAKTAGDVAEGIGGMLPAIAIGLIPGIGSAPAMAITSSGAAGNAIKEAKEEGASDSNAMLYGLAVGGVELATEKLLDGLGGVLGKGIGDDFVKGIVKKAVKNEAAQTAINGLIGVLGEGFEEWISEYANHFLNNWLVQSDERSLKEVGSDAIYSALIGALVGGLVQGGTMAAKGMKPDANALAEQATAEAQISPSESVSSEPTTDTTADGNAIRVTPGEATDGAVEVESGSTAMGKPDLGAAPAGFTQNEGEQVKTQSKTTTQNINLDEAQRAMVAPGTHERISEAESLHRAQTGLYTDSEGNIVAYQESIDDLVDSDRALSGVESDRLQLLLKESARRSDVANIKRIAKKLQENNTFVAQALQANQKWIGDDPATKLAKILTIADKWAQTHKTKKGGSLEVPDSLIEEYTNAKTDAEREAVVDKIQTHIAENTGSTLLEKWNALRYTNMLGNFKTQGRNLLGNIANRALYSVKNEVATLMELALPAEQRTKSAYVGKEWMQAAKADYANAKQAINRYGKYTNENAESDFTAAIEDQRNILGEHNPLEYYRKGTKWAMEKGDEIFSKGAYARALAGYLKAKGVDPVQLAAGAVDPAIMEQARAYAVKQAQEVTFRDSNAVSDWAAKVGRRADTPKPVKAIAEGIAPFRRTPANVLVRAEEYSPLGLINTAVKAVQAKKGDGDVSASDVIDQLSKSVSGSVLFAIGLWMADNGLLRATGDDEAEDVDALMNAQDYSLTIPGVGSYTLDWLTPASLVMFTGAELSEILSDEGLTWADVESVITSLADPLVNMSMLSGVSDTLDNIKYSDNNLIQMAATSALSYLTQGLTNTLAGQIERITEPERMTTYVDKENAIPDWLERSFGKASAKTPGWEYNQTEYLDEFGNTESNGTLAERIMENLFSPGYFSPGNEGKAAYDFAQETYDTLGYNPAPSAYPESQLTEGKEKYKLSQSEKEQYQKVRGQTAEELLAAAADNAAYDSLSEKEKIEVLKDLKSYASKEAKVQVLKGKGVPVDQTSSEKAIAALGAGDMVTFYSYWNTMDTPAGYSENSHPDWQKFQTVGAMGFDDEVALALIESMTPRAADAKPGTLTTGEKIRKAYDMGIPLNEILDYYEAINSKLDDGEAKKAVDKRKAVNELTFSKSWYKGRLNNIF